MGKFQPRQHLHSGARQSLVGLIILFFFHSRNADVVNTNTPNAPFSQPIDSVFAQPGWLKDPLLGKG